MALTPRLELRQSQTLVMTPQMQQAIKLLQMSNVELGQFVESELLQNPLLSLADQEVTDEPAMDHGPEPIDDSAFAVDRLTDGERPGAGEAALDMEVENRFDDDRSGGEGGTTEYSRTSSSGGGGSADPDQVLANTVGATEGLYTSLVAQIGLEFEDATDRGVAVLMLEYLDESGYFTGDVEEIAVQTGLPASRISAILARLATLDPPGIFATDLRACLAQQLVERNRLDPAMSVLLDNLDLLAKGNLAGLVKRCGLGEDEVRDMIDEVRALDPKPALAFQEDAVQPVVPDILLHRAKGGWRLELNPDTLPRLLVDREYLSEIRGAARSAEDRQFVSDCVQSANWLIKSLHQRATTILKVAEEILRAQEAFFLKGPGHLKPLVLRSVAEAIDMHESTVSRVTSNKYMATPHGVFELKYFFTSSVGGDTGDGHSAESVKHRIRGLIDGESPDKVLSDDHLVGLLREQGVDVARRTVAKYREALGIPSSVRRRRQKSLAR